MKTTNEEKFSSLDLQIQKIKRLNLDFELPFNLIILKRLLEVERSHLREITLEVKKLKQAGLLR